MASTTSKLPPARHVIEHPTAEELRELAARMANARWTRYGNLNIQTRVVSRSPRSTYMVSDRPIEKRPVLSREQARELAKIQDAYIAEQEMILVDGWIGNDPHFRTRARLYVEASNANIAAMQQQLYFHDAGEDDSEPELTVIYTPNLPVSGFPDDRLITVDLHEGVTRAFNSDYFGESKKGGLRMWNRLVHERGGLALHAGLKMIPVDGGRKVALIVGLSGTGKTTTTFTRQNNSLPVQDDFVAWMPDGHVYATERGCFAKTYALSAEDEPTIFGAVTRPEAYLENVSQTGEEIDFFDTSYTPNGRSTFTFDTIESAADHEIRHADFLLILNRNENVIPAVARLQGAQAAAFFMLGETRGTSAGGADEAGKFLRVPGTNPFFPLPHDLQGNRFLELLERHPLDVYLMNTGWIGGTADDEHAKKVRIPTSSAIVKGIAESTITWERDHDYGYLVASDVPGVDDIELLQPKRLYERTGQLDEYWKMLGLLKHNRVAFLEQFPSLSAEIVYAVS
ncbi:MAG: phosphoenolpyruvate carboxykinase [Gaiellaceae bacterium]